MYMYVFPALEDTCFHGLPSSLIKLIFFIRYIKDYPYFSITFHNAMLFSCFKENTRCSWTSAYFLPHWADPSQLKSTEVSYDYHEDDELSSLECYKEELSRQLGMLVCLKHKGTSMV